MRQAGRQTDRQTTVTLAERRHAISFLPSTQGAIYMIILLDLLEDIYIYIYIYMILILGSVC